MNVGDEIAQAIADVEQLTHTMINRAFMAVRAAIAKARAFHGET